MTGRPSAARIWLEATRPRTLPAAVAPVLVGTALALRADAAKWPAAAACLGFALLVQVGTNFANDYYDAQKGADTAERVGPRRAVASGLVSPATMRAAMIVVFAAAFAVGLTLLAYGGWPLLVVGVLSIACGVAYTGGPYPLAYHGLGDVFVFIFFGLVAVGATTFVQAGELGAAAWIAGAGVGALATNILVANNYRDVETDAKAGKRTLLVAWGRGYGRAQFAAAHGLAVAAPPALALIGAAHGWAAGLVAGLAAVVGLRQCRALAAASSPAACIALLAATGRWLAIYGGLLAAAIAWR
ncbi:MAG: 1,4-dihydroxy-2-naphthoate polyprenyltransferase [Opitutaceae bacterium]|jgi:1,4-dihydroxy-2-naphthoate octaprenyltransferase|nr:1,4-dihydroxy-2-naphthoate polyprenyltransferase [Opitutaceae bacterium]